MVLDSSEERGHSSHLLDWSIWRSETATCTPGPLQCCLTENNCRTRTNSLFPKKRKEKRKERKDYLASPFDSTFIPDLIQHRWSMLKTLVVHVESPKSSHTAEKEAPW